MAESFEKTEYTEETEAQDRTAIVYQIVHDKTSTSPNCHILPHLTGNMLKLTYHCYEMNLPPRMKEVEEAAQAGLKEMVSYLKKEFKSKTKESLTLKEKKELENYSVQKVSLNERYMYSRWKFFEIS